MSSLLSDDTRNPPSELKRGDFARRAPKGINFTHSSSKMGCPRRSTHKETDPGKVSHHGISFRSMKRLPSVGKTTGILIHPLLLFLGRGSRGFEVGHVGLVTVGGLFIVGMSRAGCEGFAFLVAYSSRLDQRFWDVDREIVRVGVVCSFHYCRMDFLSRTLKDGDEMSPFDKKVEDDDECGVTRRASGVATRRYA